MSEFCYGLVLQYGISKLSYKVSCRHIMMIIYVHLHPARGSARFPLVRGVIMNAQNILN